MERPALALLLAAVEAGAVDAVIVYKVDRLTRSLADFARGVVPIGYRAEGRSLVPLPEEAALVRRIFELPRPRLGECAPGPARRRGRPHARAPASQWTRQRRLRLLARQALRDARQSLVIGSDPSPRSARRAAASILW
jgi:hypothetical protein